MLCKKQGGIMKDLSVEMHNAKTIVTKDEFQQINEQAAIEMSKDTGLQDKALDVLVEADRHRWIHQNSWFGEPLLNLPQDMFAIQDIIWRTKPEFVIEVGVAWGGAMLFEAMLLEILGGEKVIGIDIFIPDDLRERLANHGKLSARLELIEGSSLSADTLDQVDALLAGSRKALVILDSFHTHEHVLNELRSYAPFIEKGQYLICGDTVVERIPPQLHRTRPWGPGNNPATAVKEFLSETDRFAVDDKIDNRLLFSCHPGGYLKAVK
ncbi:MAG: CmcI family methyltransferase [Mariprofundales bacterium]|nr:CmcI family methyltransferase [Mariprofundales bacterium]